MPSLIDTTVGEVREACKRAYAEYDAKVTKILAEFDMKVAQYDSLPWWKRVFSDRPRWDWHREEWWESLRWRTLMDDVWRLQQSIKDVPNHTVMHITTEDARLIKLGTLEW